MKNSISILTFALLVCIVAPEVQAAWPVLGNPVCTDPAKQSHVRTCSDGSGGMFVVWKDERGATTNFASVYVAHIDALGDPLWSPNGVLVRAAVVPKPIFDGGGVAPDGQGGVFVFWSTGAQVWAQRLNASGALLWNPSGVFVDNGAAFFDDMLISDGAGGAVVAYGYNGARLQRLNGAGVLQWPGGIVLATNNGSARLVSDGAGGIIAAYNEWNGSAYDTRVNRVNAAGAWQWGATGVSAGTGGNGAWPRLVSDGAGGAVVSWWNGTNVYAQRFNGAGSPLWTAVNLGAAPSFFEAGHAIAQDAVGGAIVAWSTSASDIRVQRLGSTGAPQWGGGGVLVCNTFNIIGVRTASDGAGDVVLTWQDQRGGLGTNFYLYEQHVNPIGITTLANNGIRLCPATYPSPAQVDAQLNSVASLDGAGGLLVAWVDQRTAPTNALDIYSTFANGNTASGTDVLVQPIDAGGSSTNITMTFDDVGDGSTKLVINQSGPPLPGTFTAGDGNYYHITTTATYTGDIEICITYDENTISGAESAVKFLHYDTGTSAWVDITTSLNTTTNTVCGVTSSLSPFVIAIPNEPGITAITDIGNDQGRQVSIRFAASGKDSPGSSTPIIRYEAYRRDAAAPPLTVGLAETVPGLRMLDADWTQVGSVAAHGASSYGINVPTIGDSTIALGQYYSHFFIRAATAQPLVFYDSPIDSGYSLDNLAPGMPLNLAYASGDLSWDESEAVDFDYFTVYGSNTNSFGSATAVDHSVAPTMDVNASPYVFYFVTATDFAGNEGKPAVINTLSGVGGSPKQFVLSISAFPNPFNPETTVRYTLPGKGHVNIEVFDARGTRVRTLVDQEMNPGAYSTTWDGRDKRGESVGSGVYFARLRSATGERSYKMTLLK